MSHAPARLPQPTLQGLQVTTDTPPKATGLKNLSRETSGLNLPAKLSPRTWPTGMVSVIHSAQRPRRPGPMGQSSDISFSPPVRPVTVARLWRQPLGAPLGTQTGVIMMGSPNMMTGVALWCGPVGTAEGREIPKDVSPGPGSLRPCSAQLRLGQGPREHRGQGRGGQHGR